MAAKMLLPSISAALAEAEKVKPASDLEAHHMALVVALLSDAKLRVESLPELVATQEKAEAIRAAELALEAAQAAQRG